jgi:hypothetical protein
MINRHRGWRFGLVQSLFSGGNMKSTILWALVVLNALLAVMLVSRQTQDNAAFAQAPGAPAVRRPGDYLMIPGDVTGVSSGLVYIIDTNNGWLGAMSYDDSSKKLGVMPRIDIAKAMSTPGANHTGTGKAGAAPGGYNR